MRLLLLLSLSLLFLLATGLFTAINGALRRLHLQEPFEAAAKYFFYRPFHLYFFPEFEYEGLLVATLSTQSITRFFFAVFSFLFLWDTGLFQAQPSGVLTFLGIFLTFAILLTLSFTFADYIPRIIGAHYPQASLQTSTPFCSIFMIAAFPITYLCLKLSPTLYHSISFEEPLTQTKREILEIIQRSRVKPELNLNEKKLIESVLKFKDRIAREIMVPRVDVFSLSADTPIREAVKLVQREGYSRIPVYRNTVDNIVGVLMYKDVLNKYIEYESKGGDSSVLDAPIETIQKGILYTPETKKISNLLLEFKKKQVHLAIVVDEYGGTEGIVSIEDILEEIVGEIEDEYDEEEEMFFSQMDGSWVVDGRMSILDVEQQLGIKIPQEGDYDTLGGYIFHCAGSIPPQGFVIHQDEFQIEILRSDERRVEKVRIKPILHTDKDSDQEKSQNGGEKGSLE